MKRNSYLIGKAFKNYLTASVLTVAATQVANIVDAALVGHFIGANGLAAVNLSKPIIQASFAITVLYASSGTMLTGMAIGNGNRRRANELFSIGLAAAAIFGLLLPLIGTVFFTPISEMLCKSETLKPLSDEFMRITMFSLLPLVFMNTLNQYVTTDGSPRLVTRAIVIGNVVHVILDVVFMKYLNMGISGAAYSTLIMYIVCCLLLLPHFKKPNTLRPIRCSLDSATAKNMLVIGLPLFFSTVLLSVQYVCNNNITAMFHSVNGLIALAVCMQLFSFSMIILTGTLRTIQPIGAILKGMNDSQGILLLMKRAYRFMVICLIVYVLAIVFFPSEIASALGADSQEAMDVIKFALPAFSLHIMMQAMLYNLMPVYQFYGHKNIAFFLSIGQTLLPMICYWIMKGNWFGFFVGQMVTAIVLLIATICVRKKNTQLYPLLLIPKEPANAVFDVSIPLTPQTSSLTLAPLAELRKELTEFMRNNGATEKTINHGVLCAEELLKNIIQHGHAHYADIKATKDYISIHDDGHPFNPIEYSEATGYGLLIVKGLCKDVQYKYLFNQNMTICKL